MSAPHTRTFETGATRTSDLDKPDYEGFLSPTVLVRFGRYMHQHRQLPDGTQRASDNWQRGIPITQYLKSLLRHVVDVWVLVRTAPDQEAVEDDLCAIIFNAQGMLHELLKERRPL